MADDHDALDALLTVRDWLRYAVSRFSAARLSYGHGTSSALDEAAFIILHTLDLPVDQLEPWIDARLTRRERERLQAIIEDRIATRKPAPYLTRRAYIRGHAFYVDERVIVPRSYIGELICDVIEGDELARGLPGVDPGGVARVLDLCTGGGSLAILAAISFPAARVDAVDLSPDALEVAARNVADYGLEDRVRLVQSDLFAGIAGESYDLILSNPPYVTDQSLESFPPEHRAEPRLAHAGGPDGLDIVRRILADAKSYLAPAGSLLVEVGLARPALEAAFPDLPFEWIDTEESEGEVFYLPAAALGRSPPSGMSGPLPRPDRRRRQRR